MHQHLPDSARPVWPYALVAAALAAAVLASSPSASASGSASPRPATVAAAQPPVSSVSTTAAPIHSLRISLAGGTTTMPARLLAGTYYVHVSTTDARSAVQVVRPAASLSLTTWYARFLACARPSAGTSSSTILRRCRAWRTSASFVGGAGVVRVPGYRLFVNPGRRGTFAMTLAPGRYWVYASPDVPSWPWRGGHVLPMRLIRVITVVGPSRHAAVPVAAVARFVSNQVYLPRTMPRRGFVLGIGQPGIVSVLQLGRLKPGITDHQLFTPGQCFVDSGGAGQALDCFQNPGWTTLGGGVSGGHSALWWYDLPPGDYVAAQGGLNEAGDSGVYLGLVTRVTIR